ncbi:olfactory receptor 1020-like [Microcaecilia unicolor]|uniref:Olfactory receptor n=1 Tax=Microcaecilia unicolor TaxID=1415580 RepID=A0A6P7ZWU6_9AMPH|nr:olfactory receptor 1020-like [Microcaecilia unicolor]
MGGTNQTSLTEFILIGFTNYQAHHQTLFFVLFFIIYLTTVLGNTGILVVIQLDPCFYTPMYFFLQNLSFLDLCYSSVVAPKMLVNLLAKSKTISYNGCATQLFFFSSLGSTECLLLSVMAYDRYVAICNPLLYAVIMTRRVCIHLVAASYFLGALQSIIQTSCTFRLSYCKSNVINHFYCDVPPLLKLSCTDTFTNEIAIFVCAAMVGGVSLLIILLSYSYIISTILKICSIEGRYKAFSTCASHFTCVIFFYGTVLFMYLRPSSSYSLTQDRVASLFYTVVIPMLNPLIYSFRNQEVKNYVRKMTCRRIFSR